MAALITVAPEWVHMDTGEGGISGDVVFSVREQLGCVGIPYLEHPDDLPQLVAGRFGVGLREDGAHGGGDHLFVPLGEVSQQVAHQMHAAGRGRRWRLPVSTSTFRLVACSVF